LGLLGVIGALIMPSAVYAADGPPTVFYVYMKMDDQTDLVKIDTQENTLTKAMFVNLDWRYENHDMNWEVLPVTVKDFLPPVEWQAFQRDFQSVPTEYRQDIWDKMSAPTLNTTLENLWEAAPDILLLYRRFSKCYSVMGPDSHCYGMTQFSLFDAHTQEERLIWTLPFHREISDLGEPCFTDILYENFSGREPVDQVLFHPNRDLVAVRFHNYSGWGCSDRVFLIDYTLEIPQVTEFIGLRSVAWSPDGTQLAYIEACTYKPEFSHRRFPCTNAYGIIDLSSMNIVFFKESVVDDDSWIAWPTDDTLVFSSSDVIPERNSLVWYDITDDVERPFSLPAGYQVFTAVTLRDQDSHIILGNGFSGLNGYPGFTFDETPGVWQTLEDFVAWSSRFTVRPDYAVIDDWDSDSEWLVDADLNRYPIDTLLTGYKERYGAEAIQFAFVGVKRS
jgi:hypothetical protein